MSTFDGLTSSRNPLRMPKGKDSTGIHFEGSVLTGEKSLQERRLEEIVELNKAQSIGASPLLEAIPGHLRPPDTRYRPTR
jgi:hypothetical protein